VEADLRFKVLEDEMPGVHFNIAAQNEHMPTIERFIWTVKDQAQSCYSKLPFIQVPKQIVIHLIYNTVFWLNASPHTNGISAMLSLRYIVTGRHINYHKHVHLEFGSYVQTHKEHNNNMEPRTIRAICLGFWAISRVDITSCLY